MKSIEKSKNSQASRLCFIIDSLNGGGAEMVVLRLVNAINQLPGAQAHLIVLSTRGDYQIEDQTHVHRLDFKSNKNLDGWLKKSQVVKALDSKLIDLKQEFGEIDALFSNLDVCHSIVRELNSTITKYFVIHSSPVLELAIERKRSWFKYWRLKKRKLALKNQKLIAVSQGVAGDFNLDWLPIQSIETIYNPFDFDGISALSHAVEPDLPTKDYILHVGRVCAAKRHDRLLEAFSLLNVPHKLVLLTKPSKKLDRLIEKYNLSQRVIVKGFQDNPFVWMKQAKLVVLSSDYEGLSNVLIESLICGTPIASTNCKHGPKEILDGFHPDWISDSFSPQSLATVMEGILTTSPVVDVTQWPLYNELDDKVVAQRYVALTQ